MMRVYPLTRPVKVPRVPHHRGKGKKPNYLPEHAGVGGCGKGSTEGLGRWRIRQGTSEQGHQRPYTPCARVEHVVMGYRTL